MKLNPYRGILLTDYLLENYMASVSCHTFLV